MEYPVIADNRNSVTSVVEDDPSIVIKKYINPDYYYMAGVQIAVQTRIQETVQEELDTYELIKIPKLLNVEVEDDGISLTIERVHNFWSTDEEEQLDRMHISLENNIVDPFIEGGTVAYFLISLNVVETFMEEDTIETYIYQFGRIKAILNCKACIALDDVEIMVGKDSTSDTLMKWYIIDFDRCIPFEFDGLLKVWETDQTRRFGLFLMGRRDRLRYNNLRPRFQRAFVDGYRSIADTVFPIDLVDNIIEELTKY